MDCPREWLKEPSSHFLQLHVRLKFLHLLAERGSGKRLTRKHQAPHPEQRAFLETLSDGPQHLMRECVRVCSVVWLFATLRAVARQAPVSVGFFRQEYWSGLPFHSSGDLPKPGIKRSSLESPALAGRFLTTGPPGKLPMRERCHLSWFCLFVCRHTGFGRLVLFITLFTVLSILCQSLQYVF